MVLGSQAERGIRSGYGIGHTDVKVVSGEGGGCQVQITGSMGGSDQGKWDRPY